MREYGIMLLRVAVGAIYVVRAYLALAVLGLAQTASLMAKVAPLPYPTLIAWIVIVVHGIGGALLVLGAWTRWVAAANALIMLVALVKVHLQQGFFLKGVILDAASSRANVAGYEYVLLLSAATVALAMIGPGAWAAGRSK